MNFASADRAQGSLEYLIIVGIVVVVSLGVVTLIITQAGSAGTVARSAYEQSLKSGDLGLMDALAGSDGKLFLSIKDNMSDAITINKISLGGVDYNFSTAVFPGETQNFLISGVDACTGDTQKYSVPIYYTSEAGLDKKFDFGSLEINCASDVVPLSTYVMSKVPVINLKSPADSAQVPSSSVDFVFSSPETDLNDCQLFIDNVYAAHTISSLGSDANSTISFAVSGGNHLWLIKCVTAGGNIGSSAARGLTYTPPINNYTVSFSSTPSNGYVDSNVGGLSCGTGGTGVCTSTDLASGTSVRLTAHAAAGNSFGSWGGGTCSGSSPTCDLVVNANKTVTASFSSVNYVLSFSFNSAHGAVDANVAGFSCAGDNCSGSFASGTNVLLSSHGAYTYGVGSWSGACSGSSPTCALVMDGNKSAGMSFAVKNYTLHVYSVIPNRDYILGINPDVDPTQFDREVDSNISGIHCGETTNSNQVCTNSFAAGTSIRLTAYPGTGTGGALSFVNWGGDCNGQWTVLCDIYMNQDRNATVYYSYNEGYNN